MKNRVREILTICFGTLIVACAVYFFMLPSQVSVGSGAALAMILSNFIPLPISAITLTLNVFLLIIGFLLVGPAFGMSYGLIKQRWFSKLQAGYLGIPGELFEDYYRDTCKIGKADMIAFLKANSLYTVKPGLSKTTAKVKIAAGTKEQKIIRDSVKMLHEAIAGSSMELLPGLRHGDLSINQPQRYVRMLTEWIGSEHNDTE